MVEGTVTASDDVLRLDIGKVATPVFDNPIGTLFDRSFLSLVRNDAVEPDMIPDR